MLSLGSLAWVFQDLPSYHCLLTPVFSQTSTQVDFSALVHVLSSLSFCTNACNFSLMLCFYFLTLNSKYTFFPHPLSQHTEKILIKYETPFVGLAPGFRISRSWFMPHYLQNSRRKTHFDQFSNKQFKHLLGGYHVPGSLLSGKVELNKPKAIHPSGLLAKIGSHTHCTLLRKW